MSTNGYRTVQLFTLIVNKPGVMLPKTGVMLPSSVQERIYMVSP